jgi:hypothetical protein
LLALLRELVVFRVNDCNNEHKEDAQMANESQHPERKLYAVFHGFNLVLVPELEKVLILI